MAATALPGRLDASGSAKSLERSADDGSVGLVERVKRGDHAAGAMLYRRHNPRVLRYVEALLKDRDAAEEVTQQTFATVFERIGAYRDEGQRFSQWLFEIARNAAWRYVRDARRPRPTDPALLDRTRETLAERTAPPSHHAGPGFVALIAALSPGQQHALMLIYGFDLRAEHAAAMLGKSPQAVRQAHRRSVAALARQVELLGLE